jgi:hypothetical protein
MKTLLTVGLLLALTLTGCGQTDAKVASHNLSQAAENFELERRIVFYNGITGDYILTIRGKCSVTSNSNKLSVTCKTSPTTFKKHYLGLSDNVTYFSEQLDAVNVSTYHYKVVFKPQSILSNVDFKGSTSALSTNYTPDNND